MSKTKEKNIYLYQGRSACKFIADILVDEDIASEIASYIGKNSVNSKREIYLIC